MGLSADSQNRLWQQYRDEANFLMTQSQNRAGSFTRCCKMFAAQNNANISAYNQSVKDSFWAGLGNVVFDAII